MLSEGRFYAPVEGWRQGQRFCCVFARSAQSLDGSAGGGYKRKMDDSATEAAAGSGSSKKKRVEDGGDNSECTDLIVLNLDWQKRAVRSLLLHIISLFGDLFLLFGCFAQHDGQVIVTLIEACKAEIDPNMIGYFDILRRKCIETFTGIIMGVKVQGNIENFEFLFPHMPNIIAVIEGIADEQVLSDELIEATCDLVGVIAIGPGEDILQNPQTNNIIMLLIRGHNSQTASTRKSANLAMKEIRKTR